MARIASARPLQDSSGTPTAPGVEALSNGAVFQRIWELYAAGRGPEILEHLDPAIEWHPALHDPARYDGHDGVRRWAATRRRAWKSVTILLEEVSEVDGCVVASGRVAAHDHDGTDVVDSAVACAAEIRDGLVVRAAAFVERDDALSWVSGRPATP
ncbi:MAG TPA: nuclear transport factor 2 family protein [Solirubrobacteraceae bacterium]|nr:nuclear transport factor 2 family protein [Solirubrobacteraceae bacterium]